MSTDAQTSNSLVGVSNNDGAAAESDAESSQGKAVVIEGAVGKKAKYINGTYAEVEPLPNTFSQPLQPWPPTYASGERGANQ